jgi:hypothetical protein
MVEAGPVSFVFSFDFVFLLFKIQIKLLVLSFIFLCEAGEGCLSYAAQYKGKINFWHQQ